MNSKNKTAIVAVVAALVGGIVGNALPAQAQLDKILKGGGVALIVTKFSGDIDRFVNSITGNKTNNTTESTRVVAILSVGSGAYAGAVQVSGPKDLVDQVKAVAQVEGGTKIAGASIRGRVLIPIATTKASDLSSLSRVKGVGVSALIDLKL